MHDYGAFFAAHPGDRPYRSNYERLASAYGQTPNLWMALGEVSNNLVAIRIDGVSPRAVDCFLPQTGLTFGTRSGSSSHRIYRCTGPGLCPNRLFYARGKGAPVELRGEGKFLLLPSSEQVFGETLEFCSTEHPG